MMHQGSEFVYIQSVFAHMEASLKNSTYMMMLMTPAFCSVLNRLAELQRDQVLVESIVNSDKRWSDSLTN